jgi:geranylgeranylglycerol-phosphate geranylgeranyltransferase
MAGHYRWCGHGVRVILARASEHRDIGRDDGPGDAMGSFPAMSRDPDSGSGAPTGQARHWRRADVKTRLMTYVEAGRPDLLTYAGLVSIAGALLTSGQVSPLRLVGAWLAPTLGWIAAMYGGDYFDRHLDAVAKPHRPIPSQRMSANGALAGMVINIVLGTVVAMLLNPRNLAVVVITLVLGVSYSKFLKARGVWGHLVRGGVTAMAFVMGTMSGAPLPPPRLLPLALVFWLHDSGSNVVGAICDRDGDRAGGYRTFPVRHGDAAALRLLMAFDIAWLALAVAYPPAALAEFNVAAFAPFLATAVALGCVTVIMLVRAPRPIPRLLALRSHEFLVFDRLVLACGLIAAADHVQLAIVLAVSAVTVTLLASAGMMRVRYEPRRRGPRQEAGEHSPAA